MSFLDFTSSTGIDNYTANWPTGTGLSTNVQFIGGTFYQGKNYLRVQGPSGITIFSQLNGSWSPVWTTYAGGAGNWSGNTYSPVTSSSITPLPSGSTITDQALINSGNVIVPVTVPPSSTDTCGVNTAAYYIYSLSNGIFPSSAYFSASGASITQGYVIGQGNAFTPAVTVFNGRLLLQSAANKNTTGGTSGFASVSGAGLPLSGPVAWRLVLQH
jgi:type IV pilus assembly protein PilY1